MKISFKIYSLLFLSLLGSTAFAQSPVFVWVEGEAALNDSKVKRHPWWYDDVKREEFSGGDFISHWSEKGPGTASYRFEVEEAGEYTLWLRANATQSALILRVNDLEEVPLQMSKAVGTLNVAKDEKPDLRFISWIPAGRFQLSEGQNRLQVKFTSENHHHGFLDAFTFVKGEFRPFGAAKPDKVAEEIATADGPEWKAWNPVKDPHRESPIDLRFLNEPIAGASGRIVVQDGKFVRESDGVAVRFWAVNGPAKNLQGEDLQHALRDLAKRGVNLLRLHGAVFDKQSGELKPDAVAWMQEVTARAKREGIYTHYSIYFPLWFEPQAGLDFLEGYNGKQHPFASLYFNPAFEARYQNWWKQLLLAPNPFGSRLIDEPALMSVEVINEDSFFFWTFADKNIPEPQLKMVEELFYRWTLHRYGSLEKAYQAWDGMRMRGDLPGEKRLDFRPLYQIITEKTSRDQDTVRFLAETQRNFYKRQVFFLKQTGFKGLITASNWHTADDQLLKPLEVWTYLPGDYIDRHGYFGTFSEGQDVSWSMRNSHVYADRSALKFESRTPGAGLDFGHPVADPAYNGLPSMISETTWTRPNRFRTEAPLFYAAYASLQGSDAIVHFAHDGARWEVKPRFWMQPWTLMSPSQMGQFPATALIYRLGYISEGKTLARIGLEEEDLFGLKGTPLVQKGNLDDLRLADVGQAGDPGGGAVIDPRIYFMGKTEVTVGKDVPESFVSALSPFLDEQERTITASNGQIQLDYGKGLLKIKAPRVEALSGDLQAAGRTKLGVMAVESSLDLGHVILVSLDGLPLDRSRKMLLQIMTEERTTGWKQQKVGNQGKYRVLDIGRDPWRFKAVQGRIALNRPDAANLTVTALDFNGYPVNPIGTADDIRLQEETVYYLIH